MNQNQIHQLRGNSVGDIVEQLPAMTAAELIELHSVESGDSKPRSTLLAAIEAENATRTPTGAAVPDTLAAQKVAWQAPDYTGPLDIEQAEWRNAHLKPATVAGSK